MSDDVVRLSMVGQILRKRWRLMLVLATLGAVVGASASLLWPSAYESSSRVLVLGDPDKAEVLSEAQIAMSLVVLDRAAARLKWGVDGPALRDSVTAGVADGDVIEINVKANSPDRARQLAEAVTQQYIAFAGELMTKASSVSGEVLTLRRDSLQKQIASMNQRISELQGSVGLLDAANAQGAAARAELQQLNGSQTAAAKELDDLDASIASAQGQAAASGQDFSVIEPPLAPPAQLTPIRLQLVAGGVVLGAVLGAFALVAAHQTDRRLWRGPEIAAALGAPILGTVGACAEAAVTSPANGSSNGRDPGTRRPLLQRLLRDGAPWDVERITGHGDPSLDYLRYRRVLARLRGAPEDSVKILVIVVDDDVIASRAVDRLAIEAASHPTSINVDVSASADQDRSTPAAVLSVVPVSAVRPTIPDSPDVSGVLVVVTSGTRTAWELLAVAEACHDAGHPVAGVLMVLPRVAEDEDVDREQSPLSAAVGPTRDRADRGPA
ncbi:MAG: hypothetical protein ACRDRS_00265 [Pseudonocardiaceae bacterium]